MASRRGVATNPSSRPIPRPFYHEEGSSANDDHPLLNNDHQSVASSITDSWVQRDLTELQHLCDAATADDEQSWERIRIWLHQHSARDAQLAAERRGDYDTTSLHLVARSGPPLDIVQMLISASPATVTMIDSFGWLPLHYACANEASQEVLMLLAEKYPESKTCVDKRKRTPLHFALGHTDRPADVETVVLLSETGAALYGKSLKVLIFYHFAQNSHYCCRQLMRMGCSLYTMHVPMGWERKCCVCSQIITYRQFKQQINEDEHHFTLRWGMLTDLRHREW